MRAQSHAFIAKSSVFVAMTGVFVSNTTDFFPLSSLILPYNMEILGKASFMITKTHDIFAISNCKNAIAVKRVDWHIVYTIKCVFFKQSLLSFEFARNFFTSMLRSNCILKVASFVVYTVTVAVILLFDFL